MKKKILITGLNGVVGSVFPNVLPNDVSIIDAYHTKPYEGKVDQHIQLNLLDPHQIDAVLDIVHPTHIIHCAAKTHIDECEKDRVFGKDGVVWKTNVSATKKIMEKAKQLNAHVTLLSTECVFDGTKKSYAEYDEKQPKNWYGLTKHEGEKAVRHAGGRLAILRSVIAYMENDKEKTIFGKFLSLLQKNKPFFAVNDQYITPTHIHDIALAVSLIVQHSYEGIFHVSSKIPITPFQFARSIAKAYGYNEELVQGKTLKEFFGEEKSLLRLQYACLNSEESLKKFHFSPSSVEDILTSICHKK